MEAMSRMHARSFILSLPVPNLSLLRRPAMNPTTLLQIVEAGLKRNTTGTALATKRAGRWIETSIDDFERQVEHFAMGLRSLGVRRGDRVGLHSENSTEWIIADQAILSLGAVGVPIYTTQPSDQIEYILRDAEATGFIVSSEKLAAVSRAFLDAIPSLRAKIGILGSFSPGMLSWGQVLELGRAHAEENPGVFAAERAQAKPDDLATLIYTSGTTGMPKGVMLSHWNLASNVKSSVKRMPWDLEAERGKRILSYLPLSHVFERMITYLYLDAGYPVWFVETVDEIMADLKTVRPIHFSSVPRLLEKVHAGLHSRLHQMHGAQKAIFRWGLELADRFDVERDLGPLDRVQYALADALVYRKLRAAFGGNLQVITCGGAALSAQVMNFMNAIGVFCGQGYGLTETSPVITVYEKGRLRAGSAGLPIEGVAVKIAGDGEILVRGPNIMLGYYRKPEATAEVIDAEGWFHTGDIGHVDADGHLYITDRKKELMKLSTGKYIAPQPIERGLYATGLVEHVVVIGDSRQFCSALIVMNSQAVTARLANGGPPPAVAPDDPAVRALFQREVDAVNQALPHWEQVKKFTLLTQPWSIEGGELTPKMSIKRRVVTEKYAVQIERMYA
jgi:long-chain acyl-CoA synthetase